jgi:hypothetical protein
MSIEFQVSLPSGVIATQRFDQATVVVGTASDCDLVLSIESEKVFRFCVELGESGATVICLHDIGMMLNRSPVFKKGEIRSLRHGDIIRLVGNDCRLTFSYTSKGTLGAAEATAAVNEDSVSYPSESDSIANEGAVNEGRITVVSSVVWNVIRAQRRLIAAASAVLVSLLVLVFTFGSGAGVSEHLPEVEIVVVVDEHQTKAIDLLDALRRQGEYASLTIENITHSIDVSKAVIFNPDSRQISFSPSEADAPNEFALRLSCVVTLPNSAEQVQQPVVIQCVFNEVKDLPVVSPIRSVQLGLSNIRPISLGVDAFDPDLPQDVLIYTASTQLPEGATIDAITGAFDWIPSESQYGKNYSIAINVSKKSSPELVSTTGFSIQLVNDTELNSKRRSYEDSLYVLWVKDPTGKFVEPFATTVAVAPGVLATNATIVMELQKQVYDNWTVWVGRIGQEELVPIKNMFVHGYFTLGREEYGEGSYTSIYFDVGVVHASPEFIRSFVDVISAETHREITKSHDVDLLSVNIDERLLDSTEVISSTFTRGKIVSTQKLSIVELSEVPDFAILEVEGEFPVHVDGAPLLIDGMLLGLYSTTFKHDNQNEKENHIFTIPICLNDFEVDSPSNVWVSAAKAFPLPD